jgi:hypothetical protein
MKIFASRPRWNGVHTLARKSKGDFPVSTDDDPKVAQNGARA